MLVLTLPGVALDELGESDIANLEADVAYAVNATTGNSVNVSSVVLLRDSSGGGGGGADSAQPPGAVTALVLLEPESAANERAVAAAFDKVASTIQAGQFKVSVKGNQIVVTLPPTRIYDATVAVGPDGRLSLVETGAPPAADPCNTIKCAVLCEGECGWSRAIGECTAGYKTTALMIEDQLGDCTGLSQTANAAAATVAGAAVGVAVLLSVVAAALSYRAKAKAERGRAFDFEQHLNALHEKQLAIRTEELQARVERQQHSRLDGGPGAEEPPPPPLPPLPPPRVNEIEWADLLKVGVLGSGNFGEVWKCSLSGKIVAAKVVKINESKVEHLSDLEKAAKLDRETISLGNEAIVMMTLGKHPHVVELIGVVRRKGPLAVVLHAEDGGDLKNVLLKTRAERKRTGQPVDLAERNRWVHEIANGMKHISGKHIVHRDLAARNVMVSLRGTCKVADFGLARVMKTQKKRNASDDDEIYESYYRATRAYFPVRWTAPEGLRHNRFSSASDVWQVYYTQPSVHGRFNVPLDACAQAALPHQLSTCVFS